jgi:hypothetical protein
MRISLNIVMFLEYTVSLKYLRDELTYKGDGFLAFRDRFGSRADFDAYYSQIGSDDAKDEFLRAATSYLFFVKNGNWIVDVPRSNPRISYFTNSFKLVATLGVIESLSSEKFEDFYDWLKKRPSVFPIEDPKQLNPLYSKYKTEFGAIRRCMGFFKRLPQRLQDTLLSCIKISGEHPKRIEKFVELLYRTRSGFAHEVKNAAELDGHHVYDVVNGKRVVWQLPIDTLLHAVEIGLLLHFNNHWSEHNQPLQRTPRKARRP